MSVLSVEHLHFAYSKRHAILSDLNLSVPANSIYGFLGSNGAGKSTTIRNMLGLLTPQSGSISVFGEPLKSNQRKHYRKMGSLIEAPSLYPNLSAHDHLRLACRYQRIDEQQITPILQKVGLADHRYKVSRKYSTGMKQRLGLAIALLHDPKLLILDEPTNGLDPQGISDIRKLIQTLHAEGKTILLSSHLLAEIEKVTTHVGILKGGRLVFEGPQDALEEWKSKHQSLMVRTNDWQRAAELLRKDHRLEVHENTITIQIASETRIPEIIRTLVAADLDVYEAKLQRGDLEELFMELNKDQQSHG